MGSLMRAGIYRLGSVPERQARLAPGLRSREPFRQRAGRGTRRRARRASSRPSRGARSPRRPPAARARAARPPPGRRQARAGRGSSARRRPAAARRRSRSRAGAARRGRRALPLEVCPAAASTPTPAAYTSAATCATRSSTQKPRLFSPRYQRHAPSSPGGVERGQRERPPQPASVTPSSRRTTQRDSRLATLSVRIHPRRLQRAATRPRQACVPMMSHGTEGSEASRRFRADRALCNTLSQAVI